MTLYEYTHWVTAAGEKFLKIYATFKTAVRKAFNQQRGGIVELKGENLTKFQEELNELRLDNELINESSIHYQSLEVEIKESQAQGLWLDLEFICGVANKKNKKDNIVHKGGHKLYTHHLCEDHWGLKDKSKFIVFKKGEKKVSLIVIKGGLSSKGKQALEYFQKMHMIVNPVLMKLCCKISGWPIAELIKQGFNLAGSKRKYGSENMTPLGFTQSGRSGKNWYLNTDGEEKEFQVENPCSRMSYYKFGDEIEDVKKLWNDEKFGIAQKLGKQWNEVKPLFDAYFDDMKAAYLAHMKYFFEPSARSDPARMNEVYFGERFHFSSNLFDQNHTCAVHHDTKPLQKGFPSGITAMGLNEDGTNRFLRQGDGELCFIELGCNVQYNKGDIVLMDPMLYHGLLPLKGPRFSLVLYNNRGTL
ncbi:predicted protein [Chaetoceros tenuissimus]|uniref:Uncharacterized protein n=1 Tax=Chaetoceros tenuissimus TaxID=426638 RepID=A0AAD3D7T0_9STRA|nr:predicted protein [Chaetoceros tenuissimus]